MKDKEKATQIGYSRGGGFPMRDACIEMANWKDQQFKEYLEKKRTRFVGYDNLPVWNAITEIINELFKED